MIQAQLAPNQIGMVTPKTNLIRPLNYFDLDIIISKNTKLSGMSLVHLTLRSNLRHIVLSCNILPNQHIDLATPDLFGTMSDPFSPIPELMARSLLPTRRPSSGPTSNLLTCSISAQFDCSCFKQIVSQ